MRDIALFLIVFATIPYILRHPYIGVLVWSWLSYMNPHRLTWGIAYNFPFAQLVAVVLFISLILDKEPKRLPRHFLVGIWILFLIWTLVTTLNAYYPDPAWKDFVRLFKIQLIIFLTMLVMHSAQRINLMIWVIYLSLGFYGIKGGVFTAITGAAGRVWGPEGTFIGDNNTLAVALLMALPLGFYLIKHQITNKWIKRAMWAGMLLIFLSVVASFSRGAFLAIFAVAGYLWLKTDKKMITAMVILPIIPLFFLFMPDSWHARMSTIENYEQDESAMARINSWAYSINVANDNVTGVGMNAWRRETFAMYAPDPTTVFAAHSIYFSVIADHGWIGFILYMTIFTGGFFIARKIARIAASTDEYLWASDLAKMTQVSLVAYATGGAFLSLSYYDLPWHLVAIVLLLQQLLKDEGVWQTGPKPLAQNLAVKTTGGKV
jgi:probable O-glycosylation ligase (exosortase A-associated)